MERPTNGPRSPLGLVRESRRDFFTTDLLYSNDHLVSRLSGRSILKIFTGINYTKNKKQFTNQHFWNLPQIQVLLKFGLLLWPSLDMRSIVGSLVTAIVFISCLLFQRLLLERSKTLLWIAIVATEFCIQTQFRRVKQDGMCELKSFGFWLKYLSSWQGNSYRVQGRPKCTLILPQTRPH